MAYSKIHPTCQTVLPSGALCGVPAHVIRNYTNGGNYRKRNGYWICGAHHKKVSNQKNGHYTNHRKSFCENIDGRLGCKCTATIVNECQLDVDHRDGDHGNDNPANLQTLCKNCHALKTKQDTLNRGSTGNTGNRDSADRPDPFPKELFQF
jgi:5-methylcytosine-specific restriction endonuclease McrA